MTDKGSTVGKTVNMQKDFLNMFLVGVGVILLFLYARIVQNKKHWIYLECAVAALYVAAGAVLGGLGIGVDSVAVYFIRLRAASFVSQAMASYFTEHSTDKTVPIAVSISNLLMRSSMLVAMDYGIYFGKFGQLPDQVMFWESVLLFLLALGDLYHVLVSKTRIYSHRTVGDPISFHVSIDALLSFCLGMFVLGFPDVLMPGITSANIREVHLHLAKLWGITLLSGAVLSFASLCYRDDEDAVGTLKAKLIVYLTAVVLAITHLIVDINFRTYGHCGLMVGLMAGLAWNAGHVVYQHEKDD